MKRAVFILITLTVFLLGCYLTFRSTVIARADSYAASLKKDFKKPTERAEYLTRSLYKDFGKEGYKKHERLGRLRAYLSNDKMPEFMRFPPGTIELYAMEGWCDDAARALVYIFDYYGLPAKQWNMQGPKSAHSAAAVFYDPWPLLYDPFYGWYMDPTPEYQSIQDVRDAMKKGKKLGQTPLTAIDENAHQGFYEDFGSMFMGPQGEQLLITAALPNEKTELGKINGDSHDVVKDSVARGMTITWHYAGHKYDRGWIRELTAPHDMQVQIILTEPANDNVLRTFKPAPEVDGTALRWNLLKDEKITSHDGLAVISLSRMNSYIDIYQIIITPQGETP